MRVTVLGCGTSSGVPQIGCDCAVCRSPDPRNRRRRCSIFIEAQGQRILVDTGPDLRQQCLDAGIGEIDALLYTHAHADHVHGIDDLRAINNLIMAPVPAYADAAVFERIRERFPYVFAGGHGGHGWWRPEIAPHVFRGPFRIGAVGIIPFPQKHGRGVSWGFRIGRFAYSTDTDGLDEQRIRAVAGCRGLDRRRLARKPAPQPRPPDVGPELDRPGRADPSLPHPHEPRGRLHRLVLRACRRRCCRHMTGS